jgi:AraC-like DNA-binding protein
VAACADETNIDSLRHYYEQARQAAANLKDGRPERLLTFYISALGNRQRDEEAITLGQEALRTLPKNDTYFFVAALLARIYSVKQQRLTGLELMEQTYREAQEAGSQLGRVTSLELMGELYSTMHRHEEAIGCLTQSIQLSKGMPRAILYRHYAFTALCKEYEDTKRYADELALLPEWKETIEEGIRTNVLFAGVVWFMYYNCATSAYLRAGHVDQAEESLRQAREWGRGSAYYQPYLNGYQAEIWEAQHRYAKALAAADSAYVASVRNKQQLLSVDLQETKLRILLRMQPDSAALLPLYERMQSARDSLLEMDTKAQLDELNTLYQTDKIKMENQRNHNRLMMSIVVGCLLALAALGWMWYSHRLWEKNKALYRYIKEQDRLAAELPKSRGREPYTAPLLTVKDVAEMDTRESEQDLATRFHHWLMEERRFADSERCTPEAAVVDLATNRTYLRDAVKNVTGKTVQEYLRDMQLDEARRLIETRPDMKMEAVAIDCGLTRPTFYRLFKERYRISPTEYRKLSLRAEKEEAGNQFHLR